MGLMNIGKKEGSEIIQLFGRGVRLKGYEFCLKRSSGLRGIPKPNYIRVCETLNIFGVHADYMQQFKEYLEEEGLPGEVEEITLPVVKNLGKVKLKVPGIPTDVNFKKNQKADLELPPESFFKRPIVVDWYPKIQAIIAKGLAGGLADAQKNSIRSLTESHLAFIDWNEVFFELVRFKNERSRYNLNISKERLRELILTHGWYEILIPDADIEPSSFTNFARCQEIVIALLKKYCDRFYNYKKDEYERPHIAYREIKPNDPNFFEEYQVAIESSAQAIIDEVKAIRDAIEKEDFKDLEFSKLQSIVFLQHLYSPLLHIKGDKKSIKVSPVELNEGEKDFILDLRKYHTENKIWFEGRELYVLRNLSKGRGIGFFEAENFHPDFILWIVEGDKQQIAFVDPKGILRLQGLNDPKIMFHEKIKELQDRLGDNNVTMSSFIISNTPLEAVKWWTNGDSLEFNKRNVFFQEEEKDTYIKMMLERIAS